MRSFIGGLFNDRENAELARKALLENGIEDSSINLLECRREEEAVVVKEKPSAQSIGLAALIGAVVLGGLGGLLGLLVGMGWLHIPSLEPLPGNTLPFQITWQYIATSIFTGLLFGGVTGAILGVATRLWLIGYRKVDTSKGIKKGDMMVAVETDDIRKETKAKLTMKEYGARKFEEFRDMWDTEIWSTPQDEVQQAR